MKNLAFCGISLYINEVNAQLHKKMQIVINGTCKGIGIVDGPMSKKKGPTIK